MVKTSDGKQYIKDTCCAQEGGAIMKGESQYHFHRRTTSAMKERVRVEGKNKSNKNKEKEKKLRV